ncbi:MAG TPA: choice-of-anchor tandem repeat GloVer-containing protein, partial [Flavipsychrobacter sp.]|nr:choice-of-anchor tandem repeat GloVer-containing protein [Flavipsychrobacter sp.]
MKIGLHCLIRKIESSFKNIIALSTALLLTVFSFARLHAQLLLGTTTWGASAHGSVFLYNVGTNSLTNIANLSPGTGLGYYPEGSFIKASNGKFYAMMSDGDVGSGSIGTVVEYDILTGVLTKKADFDTGFNGTGGQPYGSFVEGMKDKLYAMTPNGGATNHGSIVEYDIATNTLTKKIDLDSIKGWTAYGTLIKASNGKLYGLMSSGGVYNKGTVIEYDMVLNTLTKKADFDGINGLIPWGDFIEA